MHEQLVLGSCILISKFRFLILFLDSAETETNLTNEFTNLKNEIYYLRFMNPLPVVHACIIN